MNTIRLTPKQRVSKVMSDFILPKLGSFTKILAETDIKYIVAFVAYGTKNFVDREDALNLKAEPVGIVTDIKEGSAFADASITDQEL